MPLRVQLGDRISHGHRAQSRAPVFRSSRLLLAAAAGENLEGVLEDGGEASAGGVTDNKEGLDLNGVPWASGGRGGGGEGNIAEIFRSNAGLPTESLLPGFRAAAAAHQEAMHSLATRLLHLMAVSRTPRSPCHRACEQTYGESPEEGPSKTSG